MAIHLGIRILDIISEVPISPDLKTTLFVQEEPLYHYIASSNFCIYASEYLCDGETKFPTEQSDHFNLRLGHESITNFIPVKQTIHFLCLIYSWTFTNQHWNGVLLCTNKNDKIYLWGNKNSFNKAFENALTGTGLFIATPNW